jgi:hypothetical protein
MSAQLATLDQLINWLDSYIEKIAAAKLDETAELLRIARIDLIIRANGISKEEFEAFLFALKADHIAPTEPKKHHRKAVGFAANN